MNKLLIVILLLAGSAFAQESKFEIKNASKTYNVKLMVEKCDDERLCEGRALFTLHKKGLAVPFQVIRLPYTSFYLEDDGSPLVNETLLYDKQSVLSFGDYNFDGVDDISLRDGNNSGYGGPSYQIYLFSRAAKKFVRNAGLTTLGQENLGMFEVDKKKKILTTFSKSGCCWHKMERYKVVSNRPVKVFEEVEDATSAEGDRVKITTKRRVNGQWKTTVKYEKRG
jgi:hypothetical protein